MFFLVSGAAGSGKSTLVDKLNAISSEITWYDFDSIGVPAGASLIWRHQAVERWIQKAISYQETGRDVGLLAGAPLGEILASPSATKLEGVMALLLDVADVTRIERIRSRKLDDPWASQETLNWAAWHRMHASDPQWRQDVIKGDDVVMEWSRWDAWQKGDARWKVSVLDTSRQTPDQTASDIMKWTHSHSKK